MNKNGKPPLLRYCGGWLGGQVLLVELIQYIQKAADPRSPLQLFSKVSQKNAQDNTPNLFSLSAIFFIISVKEIGTFSLGHIQHLVRIYLGLDVDDDDAGCSLASRKKHSTIVIIVNHNY